MTAAIWSTPPDKCTLDFPARTLIQFLHNHHLLQLTGKPKWLTFKEGRCVVAALFFTLSQYINSHAYVNAILEKLPKSQLHLSTPISSVNTESGVSLRTVDGQEEHFDRVILTCHSDTALSILRNGGDMKPQEDEILNMFQWNKNNVVLHSDPKV